MIRSKTRQTRVTKWPSNYHYSFHTSCNNNNHIASTWNINDHWKHPRIIHTHTHTHAGQNRISFYTLSDICDLATQFAPREKRQHQNTYRESLGNSHTAASGFGIHISFRLIGNQVTFDASARLIFGDFFTASAGPIDGRTNVSPPFLDASKDTTCKIQHIYSV